MVRCGCGDVGSRCVVGCWNVGHEESEEASPLFFCVVVFFHTPWGNVLKLLEWCNSIHAVFSPSTFGLVLLSRSLLWGGGAFMPPAFGWWCFPIRRYWVVVFFSASFPLLLLLGGGTLSFPSLRGAVSLLPSLTCCSIRLCHWVGIDVFKSSPQGGRSKAPPPEGLVRERHHHPKRGGGESTATQRRDRKAAQLKGGKGKSPPPSFLRGDLSLLQKKRC